MSDRECSIIVNKKIGEDEIELKMKKNCRKVMKIFMGG